MQIMRGGDAVMTMAYSSRSVPLAKSGDFDFTWNGAIRDVGNWAVLKNGPNTKNAMAFLGVREGRVRARPLQRQGQLRTATTARRRG